MSVLNNAPYSSPYSSIYDPNYITKLEEENRVLREQQKQMSDPLYVEFQNTSEYQNTKKDNFLTFLYENVFTQWQASKLGQQFIEWDKKQFEAFKAKRMARNVPQSPTQTIQNNLNNMNQAQQVPVQTSFMQPNLYNSNSGM